MYLSNCTISYQFLLFSVRVNEDNTTIFDNLTRRIEHVSGLKANTTEYGAEHMLVSDFIATI